MDIENNSIIKYCEFCHYYYCGQFNNKQNNYCYCGYKCIDYNINKLIFQNIQNSITKRVWDLYNFTKYFKSYNYETFNYILNKIFTITLKKCCIYNIDLLFIIAGALFLKDKRRNINKQLFNFTQELILLTLDFYFSIIFISDFNFSISEWYKFIYDNNNNNNYIYKVFIPKVYSEALCLKKKLYIYNTNYIQYLKNLHFNIYLPYNILFNYLEIIINI